MTGRVAGKTALVSGAATGIGQSIAARLAAEGAQVAVADIDEMRGAEVVKAIREADGDALFVSLDVTEETAWRAAIDVVESEFGGLDILVNNAGIAIVESVDKMSFEDWRAVMAVISTAFFSARNTPFRRCAAPAGAPSSTSPRSSA